MLESSQKKFFIVFIVVVIAFVGYWVFDALYSRSAASPHEVTTLSETPPPFFGNTITNEQSGSTIASPQTNLTYGAINDISKDLIASLQDASSTSKEDLINQLQRAGSQALSPETLSTYATPDKLGLVQDIPDSALSIHEDSSPSAIAAYKNAYANAIKPLAQLVAGTDAQKALNAFIKENDTADLDNLIKTYDTIYMALQTIPVPRSAISFHKDNMKFFANEKIVFAGIRGYKDDPLRAYLLGEQLIDLSDMWHNILIQYQNL